MTHMELAKIAEMLGNYMDNFPQDSNDIEKLVKSHCLHSHIFVQAILNKNDLSDDDLEKLNSSFSRFFLSEAFLLYEFFLEGYINSNAIEQNDNTNKALIDKIKQFQVNKKLTDEEKLNSKEFRKIKQALSREWDIEQKYRAAMKYLSIDEKAINEYWSFFDSLRIIRNKCNHGWPEVKEKEQIQLDQNFREYASINSNGMLETKLDENFYLLILNKLYEFFSFFCSVHFKKGTIAHTTLIL